MRIILASLALMIGSLSVYADSHTKCEEGMVFDEASGKCIKAEEKK